MIIINYLPEANEFLDDLIDILYLQDYFSYLDNAIDYQNKIRQYISVIDKVKHYKAPLYFNRYGKNMSYIKYRANRRTTWYIFFQQKGNQYLVRYITNNHAKGHYIRSLK